MTQKTAGACLCGSVAFEISGAFGPLAGKAWRIGLMGTNATAPVVNRLVKNLAEVLGR